MAARNWIKKRIEDEIEIFKYIVKKCNVKDNEARKWTT